MGRANYETDKAHKQLPEGYRYPGRAKWPCEPETGFAGDFLQFDISTVRVGFQDRDRDSSEPELPHRHDGDSGFAVYEFDLQRG